MAALLSAILTAVGVPGDRPDAHLRSGGSLNFGWGCQARFHRCSLRHLSALLCELVWSAPPGQSHGGPLTFPPQEDRDNGRPRQVQHGGDLTDRLVTHVATDNFAPQKFTQLLTTPHFPTKIITFSKIQLSSSRL